MNPRFGLAMACCVCATLVNVHLAVSQTISAEYQVKAAFLYNFAKFIDWPVDAFINGNSPFTICLASDPFQGELERIIQDESLDRRTLMVRRIAQESDIR